jgi:hypothetical protein
MLRVSIHAGPLRSISRFNRTDWLDIGYKQLDRRATYKIVLFKIGEDAMPPVMLRKYPRWSASLWDLSARAITRSLYPVPDDEQEPNPQEQVPAAQNVTKKRAFAETMSAVIQHIPNSGGGARRLAAMEIREDKSSRCLYRARIEEDLHTTRKTEAFTFAPSFLRPAELVLRATLFSFTGNIDVLPSRPVLLFPKSKLIDGIEYVAIHQIKEPARTGLIRWLYQNHRAPVPKPGAPEGLVDFPTFNEFLNRAV